MQRLPFLILTFTLVSNPLFAEDAKKAAAGKKKAEKVTYDDHVLPIFRARCGSCHNANDQRGGLVLDQYGAMMEGGSSGEVIDPGDAEFSYLWSLVNHEDTPKMPPKADKLPENELAVIRKWIDLGALQNAGSVANIKKKPTLAKIEVSTARPADIAMPLAYLGEPAHVLTSPNAVTALTTSPWAPITAVSGHQQIALYHSQTLEPLGTLPFPEGQPRILKFSRNGSLLLAGGGRGGQLGKVVVYDVKTGERKIEVGNEYDQVLAADISSDQSLVALGGPKKMLRVYSTVTGELVYEVKKHTDWITSLEFSPDGVLLATGDRSNGLIVWEADAGKIFFELKGHKGAITDISWRPDSNVVASSSEDGTVKLWEMTNGKVIKSWSAHSGGVSAMDYTREGNIVTIGRDKVARLWKGDGAKLKDFGGFKDIGMSVAYDAETKRVFGGDWTGMIQVFNSVDGAKVGEINTNPPTIAMTLTSLQPQLQQAQVTHTAKAKVLADLNKKIAGRKVLADQALAATTLATTKATQTTAQKKAAEADTKAKQTAATQSVQVSAAAKIAADQSAQTLQTVQQQAAVAKTKSDQQTAKVNQVKAALKASAEGVAKATQTHQLQLEAAKPTPDEQAVLATNPTVKAAVQRRADVAKSAEAALTVLKLTYTQSSAQLPEVEKTLATVNQSYQTANNTATAAATKSKQLAAAYVAATQKQTAAQLALNTSKANLTKLVAAEKAAVADLAVKKANSDKLAVAAKPTPAELKALPVAQAAATASHAALKSLQDRVNRMKAFQAQVASATAKVK